MRQARLEIKIGYNGYGFRILAISDNGQHIATSSSSDIILWYRERLQQVWRLPDSSTVTIHQLKFTPDNRHLLVCNYTTHLDSQREEPQHYYRMTASLLDLETRETIQSLRTDEYVEPQLGVQFSHDGAKLLLYSSQFLALYYKNDSVWELQYEKKLGAERIETVAILPGNEQFISGGSPDCRLKVWNLGDGALLKTFREGHKKAIVALSLSLDETMIATSSLDGAVKVWRLSDEELLQTFAHIYDPDAETQINDVFFMADNNTVLVKAKYLYDVAFCRIDNGEKTNLVDGEMLNLEGQISRKLYYSKDALSDAELKLLGSFQHTPLQSQIEEPQLVRCSADGKYFLIVRHSRVTVWSLKSHQPIFNYIVPQLIEGGGTAITNAEFSPVDSTLILLTHHLNQAAFLVDIKSGDVRIFEHVGAAAFSSDGRSLGLGFKEIPENWLRTKGDFITVDLKKGHTKVLSGDFITVDLKKGHTKVFSIVGEGDFIVENGIDLKTLRETFVHEIRFHPKRPWIFVHQGENIFVWDIETRSPLFTYHASDICFTPNGRYCLTNNGLAEITQEPNMTAGLFLHGSDDTNRYEIFSPYNTNFPPYDCQYAASTSYQQIDGQKIVVVWDMQTKKMIYQFERNDYTQHIEFSPDGRCLLAVEDGSVNIWDLQTGQKLGHIYHLTDDDWVVIGEQGHFDASNLERDLGISWIMEDEPLRPYPLEIFIKDYFEPQLLKKLLSGHPLSNMSYVYQLDNLLQPDVQITHIVDDDVPMVSVTVKVEETEKDGQRSGAKDLHLFRDGQLVGFVADPGTETFSDICLTQNGAASVEFSAYAFNSIGVKSMTARETLRLDPPLPVQKGCAYIIPVGVNSHADASLTLNFAANDARAFGIILPALLHKQIERYSTVVTVPLISDDHSSAEAIAQAEQQFLRVVAELGGVVNGRFPTSLPATKETFLAVIDTLAGRDVGDEALAKRLKAMGLKQAKPEDLVLISFSGHGQSGVAEDDRGGFYFLFSNVGDPISEEITKELGEKRARLAQMLSSDELTAALRDVDAGDTAFIIDACHSAAVQDDEFKPGPMGSSGLAQLAYNKGMLILAASQADDVALENRSLKHGLLTYALLDDGLHQRLADFGRAEIQQQDQKITLTEWLSFAVEQVPRIHERVKASGARLVKTRASGIDLEEEMVEPEAGSIALQQPALFNFRRKKEPVVVWQHDAQPNRAEA